MTVSSATCRAHKTDGTPVTAEANATIQDNGTATVKIFADIEAGDEAGGRYVEFTYFVGSWTGKARLVFGRCLTLFE